MIQGHLVWVIMQYPDYVIDNVVWREKLLTGNFSSMIEVISIEDVVVYFESVTVLEQFFYEFHL